jgi:hypothetical protein
MTPRIFGFRCTWAIKKEKERKRKKKEKKNGREFWDFRPNSRPTKNRTPPRPNPTYTPNAKAKGKNVMPKGRAQD